MGKICIADETYIVGKAKKSPVNVEHVAFIPEEGRRWKVFSRHANESDAKLQRRILDCIHELQEVRTSERADPYPVPRTSASLTLVASFVASAVRRNILRRPQQLTRRLSHGCSTTYAHRSSKA